MDFCKVIKCATFWLCSGCDVAKKNSTLYNDAIMMKRDFFYYLVVIKNCSVSPFLHFTRLVFVRCVIIKIVENWLILDTNLSGPICAFSNRENFFHNNAL